MIRWSSLETARSQRIREVDEGPFRGRVTYLIESEPADTIGGPAPQVFLAEQAANWSFIPHFHLQDEFQVIVAGAGALAGAALAPVAIHYAARETVYGPLDAGPEGLAYFTIRGVTDSGIWPLSEARRMATPGLRRFQTHSQVLSVGAECGDEAIVEPLSGLPDGAGCWLHRLAPGRSIDIATAQGGSGTFVLVLGGELTSLDATLAEMSVFYRSADEPATNLTGGADGCELPVHAVLRALW